MPVQEPQTKEYGLNLVRDLKLPPAGFNVRTASERELQLFGIPRRPDADKHPGQAALWDKFAARSLRFVRPKLVPLQDRVRSQIRDFKKNELTSDVLIKDVIDRRLDIIGIHECWIVPLTSTNWSGAVVNRPASESLVTVTGQWVVPSVSPPATAWNGTGYNDGTYICAVWVGLDGWNGTGDVLQAGTNSTVTVSGGVVTSRSSYSWIEWFGNPWTPESDFPVNPGETILCTVCAPFGNAHGTALFVNQTTGLHMNYGIDPPANVTLSGNVAEWIVEDPGQIGGPLFPFPNYGLTIFQNCSTGSKDVSLNLHDACPINLLDGSGNVISESTFNSDTSLTCNFL
jgi:peptidase A4-like protein